MTKGSEPVSPEHPRLRLEALAAQAQDRVIRSSAELERRRGQPAEPGDLFVLPATADLPVEWAILERRSDGGGRLLAVPADTNPLAGTADVEVGQEDPGGPLILRCGFGVWLAEAVFDPELRSGSLAPETATAALERRHEVESGSLAPSPLAEEVDADPEYREWIREVPERAAALVAASRPPAVRRFPSRFRQPPYALAAAFALLAIGLSFQVIQLRREVKLLSEPLFDVPSFDVSVGEDVRGRTIVRVPREASHVMIMLSFGSAIEPQDGYVEIVHRRTGELVARSRQLRLSPDQVSLVMPRKRLPNGDYLVRVYPESGFGARPLTTESLRVETAE